MIRKNKALTICSLVVLFGALAITIGCSGESPPGDRIEETEPETESSLLEATGPELATAKGKNVSSRFLEDKDYVLLYFSAEWCPPCRQFTPLLVDFYRKHAEKGNLEVVFFSLDRSSEEMYEYMQVYEMEWPAVPYERRQDSGLAEKYNVSGIPRLLALDGDGEVVKDSISDGLETMLEDLTLRF